MPLVHVMLSSTNGASHPLPFFCSEYMRPTTCSCSRPMVPAKNRPAGSTAPSLKRFSWARRGIVGPRWLTRLGVAELVGGKGREEAGMWMNPTSSVPTS